MEKINSVTCHLLIKVQMILSCFVEELGEVLRLYPGEKQTIRENLLMKPFYDFFFSFSSQPS